MKIIIMTKHGNITTKIPKKWVELDLVLYWIDKVCKENVNDWFDYIIL